MRKGGRRRRGGGVRCGWNGLNEARVVMRGEKRQKGTASDILISISLFHI